jgi:ribosomal protein S4
MSFHNYEKKVNRKTNKIRQVIDDTKKNIKCSGKKCSKKNRFEKQRKEKQKPTFSMKKHDSRQFLLILFRKKFSPIAVGERNIFSYENGYITFTVKQRD